MADENAAASDEQPAEQYMFIAYSALLLMAIVPIWIGSMRAALHKMGRSLFLHLDYDAQQRGKRETSDALTTKDAYMFPLVGSCVLFGLYMLFKLFSKEYINALMTAYFLLFGLIAVVTTVAPWTHRLMPPRKGAQPWELSFKLPWDAERTDVIWYGSDLLALAVAVALGAWYVASKHWVASNLLGLAFSTSGITYLSLGSYKVGAILLSGLFFYDIFWVFGTDVMVTVAKNFDAPIKLLFPRNIFADTYEFSMLGLGDIVIPGIFIALLLRFDARHLHQAPASHTRHAAERPLPPFARPYFLVNYAAYIAGLVTTIGVMHFYKAAQPALLYLVPFCLGASLLTAAARGEVVELVTYTEEEEDEKKEDDKQD